MSFLFGILMFVSFKTMTKMDLTIQKESTVSGTLGVVLRVSQIMGLAPLKFKRVHEGWRIRISHAANLYGKIIIIMNCIMIVIVLILDYNVEPQLSKYFKTNSDTAAWISTLTFLISSLLAAAFTGISRMQCVITSLTQLQKVNTELSKYGPLTLFKTRILFISSFCACIAFSLLFGVPLCSFIFRLIFTKHNLWVHILDLSLFISGIMNKYLILQVTLILATVPASISHLNNCLTKLLRQIRHQHTTRRPLEAATVNHLRTLYDSLYGVIQNIDSGHGVVLVQLIPVFLTSLVTTVYKFIINLLTGEVNRDGLAVPFTLVAIHMTQMVMIIEPCHLTYKQIEHTKRLIGKLLLFTPPAHQEVIHELESFYEQLMNDIVYTPMGIFYLDRNLLVTIVGGITTYLVIVVNL